MSDFKVGDRVRVTDQEDQRFGQEFTITRVEMPTWKDPVDPYYVVGADDSPGYGGVWPTYLELVQ